MSARPESGARGQLGRGEGEDCAPSCEDIQRGSLAAGTVAAIG